MKALHATLTSFGEMWYQIFVWALLSSFVIHVAAAAISFAILRRHRIGKFFPLLLLLMGIATPLTSGAVNSAVIAFIYVAAKFTMIEWHALMWGMGQTALAAGIGITRILATL
ncbi:transmembrane protein 170A [Neocloeon triangulifer]|uniref:transmembrane protein 170A n=1 Tax=Neocloeon triangulifer TaxID=2078957 RepID=UPI00286F68CC|nr:transmembrane protein 170A [Neocloeon triangulifer]